MRYQAEITLRDGRNCLVRSPEAADAATMLAHLRVTSGETRFLLRAPDEITMTIAQEEAFLNKFAQDSRALMLCAYVEGSHAAVASFAPVSQLRRCLHRCDFGISVKRAYWGLGIGDALSGILAEKAKGCGFERMELEVVAGNDRAIALYKKRGFIEYGRRPQAFRYADGSCADECLMSLPLQGKRP